MEKVKSLIFNYYKFHNRGVLAWNLGILVHLLSDTISFLTKKNNLFSRYLVSRDYKTKESTKKAKTKTKKVGQQDSFDIFFGARQTEANRDNWPYSPDVL